MACGLSLIVKILRLIVLLIGAGAVYFAFTTFAPCIFADKVLLLAVCTFTALAIPWLIYEVCFPADAALTRRLDFVMLLLASICLIGAGFFAITTSAGIRTEDNDQLIIKYKDTTDTAGKKLFSDSEIADATKAAAARPMNHHNESFEDVRPYFTWKRFCNHSVIDTKFEAVPSEKKFYPTSGLCSHLLRTVAGVVALIQGVLSLVVAFLFCCLHPRDDNEDEEHSPPPSARSAKSKTSSKASRSSKNKQKSQAEDDDE